MLESVLFTGDCGLRHANEVGYDHGRLPRTQGYKFGYFGHFLIPLAGRTNLSYQLWLELFSEYSMPETLNPKPPKSLR